jgi:hypothetical protein
MMARRVRRFCADRPDGAGRPFDEASLNEASFDEVLAGSAPCAWTVISPC